MTVRRPDDIAARKSKAITGAISKRLQKGFGKNPGPGFPNSNRGKNTGGSIPRMPGNTGPKFPSGDLVSPGKITRPGEDSYGMTRNEKSRMTKLKNRVRADGKQTRQETKRVQSRRRELQNTTYSQRQAKLARGDKNAMVPMKRAQGKYKHPVGSLVNSTTNNPFISGAASRRLRRK